MVKFFLELKDRYVNPKYQLKDRLYFLFATAGVVSAFAAFVAALISGLPTSATAASLLSFFIMALITAVSVYVKDTHITRIVCSVFLNFFMFPILFWVTGGVNCGMLFYFIIGLSVATLVLDGALRIAVVTSTLVLDVACLYIGFRYPHLAYSLSYYQRQTDTLASFVIVSFFIVAVIVILSAEHQKEHVKAQERAEQLRMQSVTDGLTALYNQRFLLDALEEYRAQEEPVSIVMFDIDDFKRINDRLGHMQGNQVLLQMAAILKAAPWEGAIAGRFGGEEFTLILPGCARNAALEMAEKVRIAVYEDDNLRELVGFQISISGGIAQFSEGMSVDDWLNLADRNLYEAKRQGKNKVIG